MTKYAKRVVWTEHLEARLSESFGIPNTTAGSIAAEMGITVTQVQQRARKLGLTKPPKEPTYEIVSDDGSAISVLISGDGGHITIVDKDIYSWFSTDWWYAHRNKSGIVYVISTGNVKLHRAIMSAPPHLLVDHRDRDGLNNRRSNLRLATSAHNCHNSGPRKAAKSAFKGVWRHECGKYGGAVKSSEGSRKSIGYYDTEREAARAHDAMARMLRGEFAFQNIPEDPMTESEIMRSPALARVFMPRRNREQAA